MQMYYQKFSIVILTQTVAIFYYLLLSEISQVKFLQKVERVHFHSCKDLCKNQRILCGSISLVSILPLPESGILTALLAGVGYSV